MLISKKKQNGFSMIEVLVSLIVIGVGLLGLSGLQIASVQGTNNAHSRNVASMLAMELTERMRANPLAVKAGNYAVANIDCTATVPSQCLSTEFCTPESVATLDLHEIMCGVGSTADSKEGGLKNQLINGSLVVSCDPDCSQPNVEHKIEISWDRLHAHKGQSDSSLTQKIEVNIIP